MFLTRALLIVLSFFRKIPPNSVTFSKTTITGTDLSGAPIKAVVETMTVTPVEPTIYPGSDLICPICKEPLVSPSVYQTPVCFVDVPTFRKLTSSKYRSCWMVKVGDMQLVPCCFNFACGAINAALSYGKVFSSGVFAVILKGQRFVSEKVSLSHNDYEIVKPELLTLPAEPDEG